MNENATTAVEAVLALTRSPWPTDRDQASDWIRSRFAIPQNSADGGLLVSENQDGSSSAGWFVYYSSPAELLVDHGAFCAVFTEFAGPPFDRTPTTAAWRTNGFLVEVYAHPSTSRDPYSSHQFGISPHHSS